MWRYTQDSIERVKEAVDMVELVGARTDLRRVGPRWSACARSTTSARRRSRSNAEHKLYHCFGCGEGGDAIRFVRETEGLDFAEAVELLAERYGVELEREQEDPQAEERRRRRERLLGCSSDAPAFYARFLWEAAEAAPARRLPAPGAGWARRCCATSASATRRRPGTACCTGAQRDGFTEEELRAARAWRSAAAQGGLYDRFRGRIMFPLADARGRVLGFGARALRDDQRAKYLNTSESELYHKGRQLFGIDRARAAGREGGAGGGGRGLHRRARAAPGGRRARRWRSWARR